MIRNLFLLLVILGSVFLLFGCVNEQASPTENVSVSNQTPPKPTPSPILTIVSPQSGATLSSSGKTYVVDVSINYQNLVLKSPSKTNKKGEGHIKYFVDDVDMGLIQSKSFALAPLSLGEHKLRVEVLNNDGSPYSPRVFKEVFFTIAPLDAPLASSEYVIEILDSGFKPALLNAHVGDSVVFVNRMSSPQSALSVVNGVELFNTKVIGPNMNSSVTLTSSGEIEYYSFVRPHVKGKLVIQ